MKRSRITLCAVLLILFLIRFSAGWFIAEKYSDFYYSHDGMEYAELARSFAATGCMTCEKPRWHEPPRDHVIPEAFRTPMLPACGGLFIMAGLPPSGAFALLQALCVTLSSFLLFRIVKKAFPEKGAAPWIALILFTIHPLILEYSVHFSSESLFILCILSFTAAFTERRFLLAAAAGATMTLTRPTGLVFLPGIMILILMFSLFDKRYTWKHACLYGICFFLLMCPYGLRNYVRFGKFSMTGFFGGFNFYVGNNRENMKAYAAGSGAEFLHFQSKGWKNGEKLSRGQPLQNSANPRLQDEYMRKEAYREIREMGYGNFVLLILRKAKHFLRPWPIPGIHPPQLFWGFTVWEIFLYIAAFAGLWIKRNDPILILSLGAIVLGGLAAHSLIHVYMRHRVPFLDPVLIVFASAALAELLNRLRPQEHLKKK